MTMPRRLLAVATALALAAPALPAVAQPAPAPSPTSPAGPSKAQQQEAATRFKKGLEAFKDGDYQVALVEFRRANELAPNYNVLYNIGQVYFQLQDYPGALTALERYLSEGGAQIPPARQAEVQRDIEKLHARVANVEITTTVSDADVSIDDVSVGKSPLPKAVLVSAGRHKITVAKAGLSPITKVIEIASGDALKVSLDPSDPGAASPLRPVEPVKVPEPVAPPPPPPPPARSTPVAGIVVTSGLALGAVATGILALNASSTLKTDRGSSTATHDQLTGDATKSQALGIVTDVLTGGAIIAFGVTLGVALSGKKQAVAMGALPPNPRAEARTTTATTTRLPEIKLGVSGSSVRLLGTF
jgi:hypothetical protein